MASRQAEFGTSTMVKQWAGSPSRPARPASWYHPSKPLGIAVCTTKRTLLLSIPMPKPLVVTMTSISPDLKCSWLRRKVFSQFLGLAAWYNEKEWLHFVHIFLANFFLSKLGSSSSLSSSSISIYSKSSFISVFGLAIYSELEHSGHKVGVFEENPLIRPSEKSFISGLLFPSISRWVSLK